MNIKRHLTAQVIRLTYESVFLYLRSENRLRLNLLRVNKTIYIVLLFLLAYSNGYSQVFLNGDLNGSVNFVSVPTSWQQIPDADPICQASSVAAATVDILDAAGPNVVGGVAGNPFSGTTFCSGLHSTDGGASLWHEGIMQTVAGFTIGTSYTINFQQAIVKQQNALDESGSWQIYLDGALIGTSAVSTSVLPFDDLNLQWDCRSVTFNATAVSQTLKFIPWDDDANLINSAVDINGALRIGIDQIEFVTPIDPTITPAGPFCLTSPILNLTAADLGGTWSGNGITDPINGTFDPAIAGVGSHDITYSITSSCATPVEDVITIIVADITYSAFTLDESCGASNGLIVLYPDLGIGPYSYSIDGGSSFTPLISFPDLPAGTYDIVIIDNVTGCSITGVEILGNSVGPLIDSVVSINPTCSNSCDGTISVYAPTAVSYSLDGGAAAGFSSFSSVCTGSHSVTITDANGCQTTTTLILTAPSGSNAQFGYSPGFITPSENLVSLFNSSTGAVSYVWEINGPNGFYDVYDYDLTSYLFPSTVGAYDICLIATSAIGCHDTLCASVVMQDDFTIFVPNTFTPDNDEINQNLVIYLNGIDDFNFEMKIYNRWGQVVFQTKDKTHFWDGTYSGRLVPDGSYTWKIVVKDPSQDDHREYFGHVNVLK